jgi:hypothetical protein
VLNEQVEVALLLAGDVLGPAEEQSSDWSRLYRSARGDEE